MIRSNQNLPHNSSRSKPTNQNPANAIHTHEEEDKIHTHLFSSQWRISGGSPDWEGGRSSWYKSIFAFSLFLQFSSFFSLFFFINSKSPSDANAEIVIFELKKKKEEGSREWGLWFFRARTQDLKLDFHLEIEFLRHDLLKKSSLTNSRYQFPKQFENYVN